MASQDDIPRTFDEAMAREQAAKYLVTNLTNLSEDLKKTISLSVLLIAYCLRTTANCVSTLRNVTKGSARYDIARTDFASALS